MKNSTSVAKKIFFALAMSLFSSCDMWNVPIKEYFEEYTNTAAVVDYAYGKSYSTDSGGMLSVPSEDDCTVTFSLRNPQLYKLTPGVSFADSVVYVDGGTGWNESDCSISLLPDLTTIRLVMKKEFLVLNDCGKDLNPVVSLYEPQSGRSFETYSLTLRCNTPPSSPKNTLVVVDSVEADEHYNQYLLCFNMPGTEDMSSGIQRDIKTVTISNGSGNVKSFDVVNTNGAISFASGLDISANKPANLASFISSMGGSFAASGDTASAQSVYYYTRDPVSTDNIVYTVTVSDGNLSTSAQISSKAVQLGDVSIKSYASDSVLSDSAVYAQDGGGDVMTVSVTVPAVSGSGGSGSDTSDATAFYTITRWNDADGGYEPYASGSGKGTAVAALASGKYRLEAYAQKATFVDSNVKTVSDIVVTANRVYVNADIPGSREYGTAAEPLATLQDAVSMIKKYTPADAISTINMLSDVTYPSGAAAVEVSLSDFSGGIELTVQGVDENGTAKNRTIDAAASAGNKRRVMNVAGASGGGLPSIGVALKNLTLTGGDWDGDGGGICVSGGTCTITDGVIKANRAGSGGGVIIDGGGTFTMAGDACKITGNSADNWCGGVRIKTGTFTMSAGEISGNETSDSAQCAAVTMDNEAGACTFNFTGGTIKENTANGSKIAPGIRRSNCSGGSFNMSGTACVAGGNYIYVGTTASDKITVNDNFTGSAAIMYGSGNDSAGAEILNFGSTATWAMCNRFSLTALSAESAADGISRLYMIAPGGTTGKIAKAGVAGTITLDGIEYKLGIRQDPASTAKAGTTTITMTLTASGGAEVPNPSSATLTLYQNGASLEDITGCTATATDGLPSIKLPDWLPAGSYQVYVEATIRSKTYSGSCSLQISSSD